MRNTEKHKIRMAAKKKVREYWYNQFLGPTYIPANLGHNHPDHGMSMEDHLAEKAKRNSEKSS